MGSVSALVHRASHRARRLLSAIFVRVPIIDRSFSVSAARRLSSSSILRTLGGECLFRFEVLSVGFDQSTSIVPIYNAVAD